MKVLSKFMATTAICTFIAGTAAAQGVGPDVGPDVGTGVGPDVGTGVGPDPGPDVGTGVGPGPGPDVVPGPGVPGEMSPPTSPPGATVPDVDPAPGTGVGITPDAPTPDTPTITGAADPATEAAITSTADAIARGEVVMAFSADGQILGQVMSAGRDERGAADFSIMLDQALGANVERATFRGMTQLDAAGNVIVPLPQAEFLERVMAQTGGTPG